MLHLTSVPIISPREHKPVISLVQDSLLGLNRITNDGVFLGNREEMMNILIYIDNFDGNLPEPEIKTTERWTGRQLVSMAIPKGLNVNMKNGSYDDSYDDKLNHVIIIKMVYLFKVRLTVKL